MEEETPVRNETEIRKSVYGIDLSDIHLGNYDNSITRPTVASARKSVLWSRERTIYETESRRRLDEFKENPYFKFEYPEIPRHWPGTWAVMSRQQIDLSVGRLSRPSSSRPRTAPLHSWLRSRYPSTQQEMPRTVKTPSVIVS